MFESKYFEEIKKILSPIIYTADIFLLGEKFNSFPRGKEILEKILPQHIRQFIFLGYPCLVEFHINNEVLCSYGPVANGSY